VIQNKKFPKDLASKQTYFVLTLTKLFVVILWSQLEGNFLKQKVAWH